MTMTSDQKLNFPPFPFRFFFEIEVVLKRRDETEGPIFSCDASVRSFLNFTPSPVRVPRSEKKISPN